VTLVAFTIVFFGKYMQELDVAIGLQGKAEPVFALFWKRTLSIVLGVAVSLLGTICIFPTFARSVLRTRCARIIQRLCHLYANISVAIIAGIQTSQKQPAAAAADAPGKSSHPATDTLSLALKNFLALEFEIQMDLIESLELIAPSSTEFSFEGVEFPASTYAQLLTQCQNILDGLLSNRLAAMVNNKHTIILYQYKLG
jgi:hypothetical protein